MFSCRKQRADLFRPEPVRPSAYPLSPSLPVVRVIPSTSGGVSTAGSVGSLGRLYGLGLCPVLRTHSCDEGNLMNTVTDITSIDAAPVPLVDLQAAHAEV